MKTIQELEQIFKEEKPVIESALQDDGNESYMIFVKSGIVNGELLDRLREKFFKIEWIASSSFEKFQVNIKVKKLYTGECEECNKEVLDEDLEEVQTPSFDTPYDSMAVCKNCLKEKEHDEEIFSLKEHIADLTEEDMD